MTNHVHFICHFLYAKSWQIQVLVGDFAYLQNIYIFFYFFSFLAMLEGWQGWWTSATYHSGINAFAWNMPFTVIDINDPNWGFKAEPYQDTCVWILQNPVYNYTWGNYDCSTQSGFVCEIQLP